MSLYKLPINTKNCSECRLILNHFDQYFEKLQTNTKENYHDLNISLYLLNDSDDEKETALRQIDQIEYIIKEFEKKVLDFNNNIWDHFFEIRNIIDLRREILFQNIENNELIESIYRNSVKFLESLKKCENEYYNAGHIIKNNFYGFTKYNEGLKKDFIIFY
jgi:hypothetical protein